MSVLPDYARAILNRIAKDEGFGDVTTEIEAGSQHGDNFLGVIIRAILKGTRHGIANSELHLLCKLAPENKHRREAFQTSAAFARELYAYQTILPTLLRFQQEKGVKDSECFRSYPQCYATIADEESDQFLIIMEDMRPQGFTMWPKNKPIALDHSQLVMQNLGHFHGISFALKDQKPNIFEKFKDLNDLYLRILKAPVFEVIYGKSLERVTHLITDENCKNIMMKLSKEWKDILHDCLNSNDARKFGIVTHGDCWNNNFLFKYNDQNEVDSISLVDWQMCRYVSPVIDLLYNIFTSTDKALRDREYQNLLRCYHNSLSNTIQRLGSDPEQLFSFDDLQSELKRFGRFAFLISPLMVRIMLADPKDIRNYDDMKNTEEELKTQKTHGFSSVEVEKAYAERINDVIGDLFSYGYY